MSSQNQTKRNNGGGIVPSNGRRGQQLAQRNIPTYLANNLDRMFEDFRTSFNQLMAPFITSPWYGDQFFTPSLLADLTQTLPETLPSRYPLLDVEDEGDYYSVTAELPGFNKENVDVQVGDDTLQLTAQLQTEQKTNGSRGYVSRERAYSSFQRAIQFPEQVIASKVEGTMKDGILTLRIPKKEPTSTRYTKVTLK